MRHQLVTSGVKHTVLASMKYVHKCNAPIKYGYLARFKSSLGIPSSEIRLHIFKVVLKVPVCRDAEMADVEKERKEQAKGPAAQARELKELAAIYVGRGVSPGLAMKVRGECILDSSAWHLIGKQMLLKSALQP